MTLVKKLTAGLALAVAIVGGSGSALAQKNVAGSQATTFDSQGAGTAVGQGTFPQQNLNSGTVVGYYVDWMQWLTGSYEPSMATTPLSMCRELRVHAESFASDLAKRLANKFPVSPELHS